MALPRPCSGARVRGRGQDLFAWKEYRFTGSTEYLANRRAIQANYSHEAAYIVNLGGKLLISKIAKQIETAGIEKGTKGKKVEKAKSMKELAIEERFLASSAYVTSLSNFVLGPRQLFHRWTWFHSWAVVDRILFRLLLECAGSPGLWLCVRQAFFPSLPGGGCLPEVAERGEEGGRGQRGHESRFGLQAQEAQQTRPM